MTLLRLDRSGRLKLGLLLRRLLKDECLQLKTPGSLGQHANYASPGSLSLCVGVELLEPHPPRTSSNNFAVIASSSVCFFAAPECNTEPLPPVAILLAAQLASITQHAVQRRNLGNVLWCFPTVVIYNYCYECLWVMWSGPWGCRGYTGSL